MDEETFSNYFSIDSSYHDEILDFLDRYSSDKQKEKRKEQGGRPDEFDYLKSLLNLSAKECLDKLINYIEHRRGADDPFYSTPIEDSIHRLWLEEKNRMEKLIAELNDEEHSGQANYLLSAGKSNHHAAR